MFLRGRHPTIKGTLLTNQIKKKGEENTHKIKKPMGKQLQRHGKLNSQETGSGVFEGFWEFENIGNTIYKKWPQRRCNIYTNGLPLEKQEVVQVYPP